jgi:hypothetical protein
MYCPTCGKQNSAELKYCAACGTNLEAVSHALTGREEDFFTKMDGGIDQLVGRYSEHVFRNGPQLANERKVSASWRLLGQALLTSLLDLLLFVLMWNLLPLRFLILVISTPFRLMTERSESPAIPEYRAPEFGGTPKRLWLGETVESVTERTTTLLEEIPSAAAPTTDRLSNKSPRRP